MPDKVSPCDDSSPAVHPVAILRSVETSRDAVAVLKLAKLPGHAGDLDLGAEANEDLQKKGT